MQIKKLIYVLIVFSLITIFLSMDASAKIYCLFDKETGEGHGATSIREDYVPDWAKKFILKEADKSYKGKKGYEIKMESGKLRHATQEEIDFYLAQKEQEQQNAINAKKKQEFLEWLSDEDVKTKIKDIKNQ